MSNEQWNRWPDAEERKARRKALIDRLNVYLDTFVDNPNGGWADATEKDREELESIFGEISNLKFARDEDGDSVTRIRVGLRNGAYDLASVYVPVMPEHDAPSDVILQYISDFHSAKSIMDSKFRMDTVNYLVRELSLREKNK